MLPQHVKIQRSNFPHETWEAWNSASEVAKPYLGAPGAQAKQLRGFEKVSLEAGESTTVYFDLT